MASGNVEMFKYPMGDESENEGYADYSKAFRNVLRMNERIVDVDNGGECFIDDYIYDPDYYGGHQLYYPWDKVLKFTVVNLDGDRENAVVLSGQHEIMLILHYMNGKVCGYGEVFRGLCMIKQNEYCLGGADGWSQYGYTHIAGFDEDGYWIQPFLYYFRFADGSDKYVYYGMYDTDAPHERGTAYEETGEIISEEEWQRIEKDIFEASPDAEFYELTDENIDHFFGE